MQGLLSHLHFVDRCRAVGANDLGQDGRRPLEGGQGGIGVAERSDLDDPGSKRRHVGGRRRHDGGGGGDACDLRRRGSERRYGRRLDARDLGDSRGLAGRARQEAGEGIAGG